MATYPTQRDKQLIKAITSLKDEKEVAGFLRDILTPAEIEEFSRRFHIAEFLWTTKLSYAQIADQVGTSTTTVTRVAQWLFKEKWQGYKAVLKRKYGEYKR